MISLILFDLLRADLFFWFISFFNLQKNWIYKTLIEHSTILLLFYMLLQ